MAVVVIVVAVLVLLGGALITLLLVGALREIDDLNRRIDLVTSAMPSRVGRFGLAVGNPVPEYELADIDGTVFSSASLRGDQHLVVFAHPGCPPCEALVPDLVRAVGESRLPPAVIVSQGAPDDHPPGWLGTNGRVRLVLQERNGLARRFETYVTPHVFVIDESGKVGAQGIAGTVEEVRRLLKKVPKRPALHVASA